MRPQTLTLRPQRAAGHRDPGKGCVFHAAPAPAIIISQCNKKCTSLFAAGVEVFGVGGRARGAACMLYQAYQAHSDIMVPVRAWAGMAIQAIAPDERLLRSGRSRI